MIKTNTKMDVRGDGRQAGAGGDARPVGAESSSRVVEGPTHADIACRAYQIWESQGCPDGRDEEHWAQAEMACSEMGRASAH